MRLRELIETPAFRRWFGDSKVVNAAGEPLVCYHGTKNEIRAFDLKHAGMTDPGLMGKAIYFSPTPEQASAFATSPHYGKGDRPNVMPVYLSVQHPLIISDGHLPDGRSLTDLHPQGISKHSSRAIQRELARKGYDGVLFYTDGELVQVAVFRPQQIKGIFNRGTWDPDSPLLT